MPSGPLERALILLVVVARHRAVHKRIARIEIVVSQNEESTGMIGVRAGLGENLNTSESGSVELRSERIRVDADFADRTLGRHLTAAESVDKNLRSVWTCGRTRHRGQLRLKIVRIVGQRVQIRFRKHNRARILGRIHADRAHARRSHVYLRGSRRNIERDIERTGPAPRSPSRVLLRGGDKPRSHNPNRCTVQAGRLSVSRP